MSAGSSSGKSTPDFADKAAETIQRNFRGFKDRLKVREKAAFNIVNLIEYAEEQDHLNLNKFFVRWIELIKKKSNDEVTKYISSSIQDDMSQLNEADIKIEADYKGIHLSPEFNEADFVKLLESFHTSQTLHTRYALLILNRAIEYMQRLENVNEISVLEDERLRLNAEMSEEVDFRVNVVGDLHGQFVDLYTIFELNGLPAKSNMYLFNGDFVDRGPQQCEVYLTLLYALCLYGAEHNCFFLNRGNHEDYGCSVRFGFKEEIMSKYCLFSKLIMKKCVHTFTLLPLASLITQQGLKDQLNKILVVHGGISLETDLNVIRTMDRFNYPSIDGTINANLNDKDKREKQQLQDLLWSDPHVSVFF
jgi:serine/threonine-protein phosphatase with EF-hand domain